MEARDPVIHTVTNTEELQTKINRASNGDVISLIKGVYNIDKSIVINKTLTIQSEPDAKAQLIFSGASNTPLFSLQPKGKLTINNIVLKGNISNYAFASLKQNMSNHFGLTVSNSEISNFNYVLKAYKESFAERITFENTTISNCENGIELSEEKNDKMIKIEIEFFTYWVLLTSFRSEESKCHWFNNWIDFVINVLFIKLFLNFSFLC